LFHSGINANSHQIHGPRIVFDWERKRERGGEWERERERERESYDFGSVCLCMREWERGGGIIFVYLIRLYGKTFEEQPPHDISDWFLSIDS